MKIDDLSSMEALIYWYTVNFYAICNIYKFLNNIYTEYVVNVFIHF